MTVDFGVQKRFDHLTSDAVLVPTKTDAIAAITTAMTCNHVAGVALEKQFPPLSTGVPLTGLVEQEGERYAGNILNISSGGFLLHLANTLPDRLVLRGVSDFGEIHCAGRNANGFGSLVRVERFREGSGSASPGTVRAWTPTAES